MAYETILYEQSGAVATITLNRPERLNTIVPPMPDEVEHAVVEANRDREVRVIILRGAGRAFCAGFDFSEDAGIPAKTSLRPRARSRGRSPNS